MPESVEQVTSFVLNHMKRTDMRAKEEIKPLDLVRITDSHITGKILKFDADKRLAYVSSTIGDRWWYVKDLELEKSLETTKHTKGTKKSINEMNYFLDYSFSKAQASACATAFDRIILNA